MNGSKLELFNATKLTHLFQLFELSEMAQESDGRNVETTGMVAAAQRTAQAFPWKVGSAVVIVSSRADLWYTNIDP